VHPEALAPTRSPALHAAACAVHPALPAAAACERCGTFACEDCLDRVPGGGLLCGVCRGNRRSDALPWDRREELGVAQAFWRTSVQVLRAPDETFARALPDAPFESSYQFAILAQVVGFLPTAVVLTLTMAAVTASTDAPAGSAVGLGLMAVVMAFYLGMWALMGPILCAMLDHLGLKLVGARPQGFNTTLRAWALAQGPMLLGIIPVCGAVLTGIWTWSARVRAYRAFHGTSRGRAFAATLVAAVAFVIPLLLVVLGSIGVMGGPE
jgi:Yip1 domain